MREDPHALPVSGVEAVHLHGAGGHGHEVDLGELCARHSQCADVASTAPMRRKILMVLCFVLRS